jgi:tetratricopeptide (TPR) repeat protein
MHDATSAIDVHAYTQQGIALVNQGRLAEALPYFEEFVRLLPQDAHGYNNLANVFLFLGRYDEAIANYRHAIELLPQQAGFHNHLSYALSKAGNGTDAEACARQALGLRPHFAEAHNHLGIALGLQERWAEAEASFLEAVRLEPHFAMAHSNMVHPLLGQGRYPDALAWAERAIELDPRQAEAHAAHSAVCIRLNRVEDALASSRQALQLNPRLPEAHLNQATAYLKLGQFDEVARICREVLRIKPDYIDVEYVLGMVALKENRLEDALGSFGRLLDKKPEDAQVHFNRAVTWLIQGNYEQGWAEYEWRWRWRDFVVKPFTQPVWDGSPLDGKTILLHAEQGLGDTLQFIRYAPLVKKRGGTVIAACPQVLHDLLSRCAGIDQLVSQETFTGTAAEHAPLLSLPRILNTTLATIPAAVPYVFADPALVEQWRWELAALPGFKVGIAWQGSLKHQDDRFRSMPLECFAALARVQGIQLVSLQIGDGEADLGGVSFPIVDFGNRLDKVGGAFVDTAAVMMSLDLVITADTATAHLAGALGVPVWVALRFAPDFRWLLERADSPWYPSARLFRQRRPGQWEDVFEQMAGELLKEVAEKAAGVTGQ